jgi:hypothetical protein
MRPKNRFLLVLTLLPLWCACTAGRTTSSAAPEEWKFIRAVDPPSQALTREDLEGIRTAAVQYYEEKKPEGWDAYVEEIRQGTIFLDWSPDLGPRIGLWALESSEGDGVNLVRRPAPARFYGLRMEKQDGRWAAVEHFEGEEFIEIE